MDDIKIVIDNLSEKDKKELYEYLKESAKEFKLQIKNGELEEMMKYYHETEQTYGGRESYPGDNLITHL